MLNLDRIETAAQRLGFSLTKGTTELRQQPCLEGEIETNRGRMYFYCISDGARILKPNGSVKYYYGPTDGQFVRVLRQTIEANS